MFLCSVPIVSDDLRRGSVLNPIAISGYLIGRLGRVSLSIHASRNVGWAMCSLLPCAQRAASSASGTRYSGLSAAARDLRRRGAISARLRRKLLAVDQMIRYVSAISAAGLDTDLSADLARSSLFSDTSRQETLFGEVSLPTSVSGGDALHLERVDNQNIRGREHAAHDDASMVYAPQCFDI